MNKARIAVMWKRIMIKILKTMLGVYTLLGMLVCATVAVSAPPPSAYIACADKQVNDSCKILTPAGDTPGACLYPPRYKTLVCVPAHGKQQQRARGGMKTRYHTVNQTDGLSETIKANRQPVSDNKIKITIEGKYRVLNSNGVSQHLTGQFPNSGNPNSIKEQKYIFKIPAAPKVAKLITPLGMHDFGLGINGVPFDPGAAEWYLGKRGSVWQYEALSGAIKLGLDDNHAHVQPTGAYHYHGIPSMLLEKEHISEKNHSPLIGWAADGFPIYALYGQVGEEVIEMVSSYKVKQGHRPSGGKNPGGHYDGTFTADYEYIQGSGHLDECNGREVKTPEFPQGSYAYFLTNDWPVIPRCYKGTPSADFTMRRDRR